MAEVVTEHVIQEGDIVVVKKDKNLKVVPVKKNSKLWIERDKFFLDSAIGFPYGTTFEVAGHKLIKVEHKNMGADITLEQDDSEGSSSKDNRNLTDTTENQKLSSDKIRSMRKQGIHGEEIVEQLIQNSATFNQKNEFARQKYIKKKKKKYLPLVTILKPTARLLLEMYYNKGPARICNLRMDSLGQLLLWSNVQAGSKMLVVESCVGLVVGAVMERLAGQGRVIHVFNGSAPVQQAVESFDFPREYHQKLYNYPLSKLAGLQQSVDTDNISHNAQPETCEDTQTERTDLEEEDMVDDPDKPDDKPEDPDRPDDKPEDPDKPDDKPEDPDRPDDKSNNAGGSCGDCGTDDSTKPKNLKRKFPEISDEDRKKRWQEKEKYYQEVRTMIVQSDSDGLIVATKFHPTPIVMNLIEFVAPSRPIAIFCQYKEPLMDCYVHLRDRGGVVLLKITETWLRGYQVLPNRTHPLVNMSGGGGYLLTGTTVKL